mmetsp:Transcript_123031/g.355559  ORF Transcript_123031/g.355559 Transcript_123031/m.355559 type:complete len:267 (-) Transcript_123031:1174-1974(-)
MYPRRVLENGARWHEQVHGLLRQVLQLEGERTAAERNPHRRNDLHRALCHCLVQHHSAAFRLLASAPLPQREVRDVPQLDLLAEIREVGDELPGGAVIGEAVPCGPLPNVVQIAPGLRQVLADALQFLHVAVGELVEGRAIRNLAVAGAAVDLSGPARFDLRLLRHVQLALLLRALLLPGGDHDGHLGLGRLVEQLRHRLAREPRASGVDAHSPRGREAGHGLDERCPGVAVDVGVLAEVDAEVADEAPHEGYQVRLYALFGEVVA